MTVVASADLLSATVRFCRFIRARGLLVTAAESRDALRALEVVDLGDRAEVHRALRTVLASRPEDFATFDAAFDAFWGGLSQPAAPVDPAARDDGAAGGPLEAHFPKAKDAALEFAGWSEMGDGEGEPVGLPGVSDMDAVLGKDFSTFQAAELAEVERLALQIARRLATRRSRRLRPSRRRGRVDMRRTVRLGLTRGELVELARRDRKILKTKLVVLCDVSGSMDLYSRLLVQFLLALQNQLGRMETFVFSTRLKRVTQELRGPRTARRSADWVTSRSGPAGPRSARACASSSWAGASCWTGTPWRSSSPMAGIRVSRASWPTPSSPCGVAPAR